MLPELNHYVSALDEDRYLLSLENVYENQGYTNAHGKELLMRYKDYLAQSYAVLVPLISVQIALSKFEEAFGNDTNFAFWMDGDGKEVAKRMSRVLYNISSGLIVQRRISEKVKNVVKNNEVNIFWYRLLSRQLDRLFARLDKIRTIVSEDLKPTPFALYIQYLEEKGVTFDSDILELISGINYGALYGNDYSAVDSAVSDHIYEIVRITAGDVNTLRKAQEAAIHRQTVVQEQAARRKAENEQKAKEVVESRLSKAEEVISRVNVSKECMSSRSRMSAHQFFERFDGKYIVCAIRVPEGSETRYMAYDAGVVVPKYLYTGPNVSQLTANVRGATKFDSLEEAEEKEKELKAGKWLYVTSIRQLDLAPYLP